MRTWEGNTILQLQKDSKSLSTRLNKLLETLIAPPFYDTRLWILLTSLPSFQ